MLTPKQQRFVEEYLVDLCAAAAARRAGYSAKRADQLGLQVLRKAEVQAAIAAAQAERTTTYARSAGMAPEMEWRNACSGL